MPARPIRDELRSQPEKEQAAPVASLPSLQLALSPEQQSVATQLVLADYRTSEAERDETDLGLTSKGEKLGYDKWLKDLRDLYFGRRNAKTEPWRNCSNRSMMIAMAIVEVLHARLLPGVYNEELTRWRPNTTQDAEFAGRIEKLMFWWVRVRAKLREFFDRWVRYAVAMGTVVSEHHYELEETNKGRYLPDEPVTDETGMQLINQDGTPAQIKGALQVEVDDSTRAELYVLEDVFIQCGYVNIQKDPVILRKKLRFRDLEEMERRNVAVNVTTRSAELLPSLKELLPVLEVSGTQSQDADAQKLRQDLYRRNAEVEVLVEYVSYDFDGDGFPEDVRLLVCPQHQTYLGGIRVSDISSRGRRPLDVTQFLPRLDKPHGVLGLGVLEQIKELAMEIDAIFNQLTDANSLSVLRPGFYDPSGDVNPAATKLWPNKWTPVRNPQQSIFMPEINIPTERLLMAIKMVLEFIERLTAASEFVFGKEGEFAGGSGTATRTQAILGSATVRHSVPLERLREGAARIMSIHLDLVKKNLPDGMENRILGDRGEPVFKPGDLRDLGGEYDAYLLPDESFGSKEAERQLAMTLYEILMQNVLVATDPAKIYKITADALKAWGKDPRSYLGPAPEIAGATSPQAENELILQGDLSQVKTTVADNHLEHMMSHQALLQNPDLTPEQVEFIKLHIQSHMQMMQLVMSLSGMAQGKGGGGGGGKQSFGSNGGKGGRSPASQGSSGESGLGSLKEPFGAVRSAQKSGASQRIA